MPAPEPATESVNESEAVRSTPEQGTPVGTLMWRRFRRNRLGFVAGVFVVASYLIMLFGEFFAPYVHSSTHNAFTNAPPQPIRFVHEGSLTWPPFVYDVTGELDRELFRRVYEEDLSVRHPVRLWVRGDEYRLFGIVPMDRHLFGVEDGTLFLFGTDHRGRDLLSRILIGGRISVTIGLFGVLMAVVFGTIIGAVSGFVGGAVDNVTQRSIEVLQSFPNIPLWMALSAAIPPQWPAIGIFASIVLVLAVLQWPLLAREVRGKVLAMRETDFVVAADAIGAPSRRIVLRHIVPNVVTHVIVIATLTMPMMILAESTLSFFGLGIQPPMISWGVLLQQAQNLETLSIYPWRLIPGVVLFLTLLAFNFVGDALRDAFDPYAN